VEGSAKFHPLVDIASKTVPHRVLNERTRGGIGPKSRVLNEERKEDKRLMKDGQKRPTTGYTRYVKGAKENNTTLIHEVVHERTTHQVNVSLMMIISIDRKRPLLSIPLP
jgi:hypothetical protein